MDSIYSVVRFFVTGGPFMYPILLVFAAGVAIAVERYVTLTHVRRRNEDMWTKVQPALADGDFDKAREMTSKDDSTVSQLLTMGLARQGAVRRREDIEIAMEESMLEIIPRLEKRTGYVALGASVATLLGLLGTIIGLIQAFTAVAKAALLKAQTTPTAGLLTLWTAPLIFFTAFRIFPYPLHYSSCMCPVIDIFQGFLCIFYYWH